MSFLALSLAAAFGLTLPAAVRAGDIVSRPLPELHLEIRKVLGGFNADAGELGLPGAVSSLHYEQLVRSSEPQKLASTLVLGAMLREPGAVARLAESGLPNSLLEDVAASALKVGSEAGRDPELAAALSAARESVAEHLRELEPRPPRGAEGRSAFAELQRLAREEAPREDKSAFSARGHGVASRKYLLWKKEIFESQHYGTAAHKLHHYSQLLAPEAVETLVVDYVKRNSMIHSGEPHFGAYSVLEHLYTRHRWGKTPQGRGLFEKLAPRFTDVKRYVIENWDHDGVFYDGYYPALDSLSAIVAHEPGLAADQPAIAVFLLSGLRDSGESLRAFPQEAAPHTDFSEQRRQRQRKKLEEVRTRALAGLRAVLDQSKVLLTMKTIAEFTEELIEVGASAPPASLVLTRAAPSSDDLVWPSIEDAAAAPKKGGLRAWWRSPKASKLSGSLVLASMLGVLIADSFPLVLLCCFGGILPFGYWWMVQRSSAPEKALPPAEREKLLGSGDDRTPR